MTGAQDERSESSSRHYRARVRNRQKLGLANRRALVVAATPDDFGRATTARVVITLKANGWPVDIIDLYEDSFVAAMNEAERHAYHGEQPIIDPALERHVSLVRSASMLIFVYPTTWVGLPAILKGWFERVLVPGVAFRITDRGIRPELSHVRRVVGISHHDASRARTKVMNDGARRILMRTIRLNASWRCRRTYLGLYSFVGSQAQTQRRFLDKVERKLARL